MPGRYCWKDSSWVDIKKEDCGDCQMCKAKRQRDAAIEVAKGAEE